MSAYFSLPYFTMVQTKCNGCNHFFKGSCGLSNHLQYNRECKAIYLDMNHYNQIISNIETQEDKDSKMRDVTHPHKMITNQCEVNQDNNDRCNLN